MKAVYADFMKCDYEGRLVLSCLGTFRDLKAHGISLEDGLELAFYNEDEDDAGLRDDLIVRGVVEFDNKSKSWVARINWNDIKNLSALPSEEVKQFEFLSAPLD